MLASQFKKKRATQKSAPVDPILSKSIDHANLSERDSQDFSFNFTASQTNNCNGFSFDFALDSSETKNRKRRERKKRQKKLKKEKELALEKKVEEKKNTYDDSKEDSLEDSMKAMNSFIESVEELKENEYNPRNKVKILNLQETNHITPPPGFQCQHTDDDRFRCGSESESKIINPSTGTDRTNRKEGIDSKHNIRVASTAGVRVSTSTCRRTPGKRQKPNKSMSVQQKARIQLMEEKSFTHIKRATGKSDSIIKFNIADKGKAMVNRGSVAVHKEKNRFQSKQVESDINEVNAFSFGFNFNNILSDLS